MGLPFLGEKSLKGSYHTPTGGGLTHLPKHIAALQLCKPFTTAYITSERTQRRSEEGTKKRRRGDLERPPST